MPQALATLFIDADACPVKEECYRVARRYGASVKIVANSFIAVPAEPFIERVVVDQGADAADDWIAERAGAGDVVVTADFPLADRCLKTGALVIGPRGEAFTADSIGSALAGRALMEHLRSMGTPTGGPSPFRPADRSRFLQSLDAAFQRLRRSKRL